MSAPIKLPLEITVCMGSSCFSRGNVDLIQELQSIIDKHNLSTQVFLRGNLCENICEEGPNVKIDNHRCTCSEKNLENCVKAISDFTGIPAEKLLQK